MRPGGGGGGTAGEMDARSHQEILKNIPEQRDGASSNRALKDTKHGQRLVQGLCKNRLTSL